MQTGGFRTAWGGVNYSITISNAAEGETYSAYKVFDATYTNVTDDDGSVTTLTSYTIEKDSTFYSAVVGSELFTLTQVETSDTYVVELKDSSTTGETILSKLSSANLTNVTADGTATGVTTGTGENATTTATISLKEAGYYYVTTTLGSVVALDSANPAATIEEKNETPTVDKTVEEDSTSTDGKTNTADIGQTVNFKSTINKAWDLTKLTYHDTMSDGLTFDSTSVSVKVGVTSLAKDIDYTLVTNPTDQCTFEIVFTTDGLAKVTENSSITITYSATVNSNAVIGSDGNDNKTYISYGEKSKSEEDKTTTYVYSFELLKTDGENELDGATFTLTRSGERSAIVFVKEPVTTGDGDEAVTTIVYRVATAAEIADESVSTTTDIEVGSATISGLDADSYILTETEAPDGYNQLTSTITIVISETGNISIASDSNSNGSADDAGTTVTVVNNSGSELPSTGGIGTTIFYIIGTILVLGAAVLLITRRRMNKAE